MIEWLGAGLQNQIRRFESARGLQGVKMTEETKLLAAILLFDAVILALFYWGL